MKKLILLLLVILMLAGCQSGSADLSQKMRKEIVAYYQYTGEDSENTVAGKQYYGIYNGYVILMDAGQLATEAKVEIDGRIFRWGSSNLTLTAYKDGAEYALSEIYADGNITEADLDCILEQHKLHFSEIHNWDYETNLP